MQHQQGRKQVALTLLAILTAVTLITTACGPSGYVEPIGKFQSSAAVVIASTKVYMSELNKVERDHYIFKQLGAKDQIGLDQIESVQVFSQDGLKARLDALEQLAKYGDLLSKLAKSDAPDRLRGEAADLGTAI